jgi:competence protein ComGF
MKQKQSIVTFNYIAYLLRMIQLIALIISAIINFELVILMKYDSDGDLVRDLLIYDDDH